MMEHPLKPPVYPTIEFGIAIETACELQEIVSQLLFAYNATLFYQTQEFSQLGLAHPGTTQFNTAKKQRHTNYFAQTVQNSRGQKVARRDTIDIDSACDKVLDDLAVQNHPLTQLVGEFYCSYSGSISDAQLRGVSNELVLQTHWQHVHAIFTEQTATWREDRL